MSAHIVGYAVVSINEQDLTAQQDQRAVLGVTEDRFYTDHGLAGTNRDRPWLRQALAAVLDRDTLVIIKLGGPTPSLPDARDIIEEPTKKSVELSIGGSIHDPSDHGDWLLFNVLAMVTEFESDPIRARTLDGMQVAKTKGRLRGKRPKLSKSQETHLVSLRTGHHRSDRRTLQGRAQHGVQVVHRTLDKQEVAQTRDERSNGVSGATA